MYIFQLNRPESVLDFRSQQVSVLIADVGGRSLEMDVHPPIALKAISRLQPRLVGLVCILLARCKTCDAEQRGNTYHREEHQATTTAHAIHPVLCTSTARSSLTCRAMNRNASWMPRGVADSIARSGCPRVQSHWRIMFCYVRHPSLVVARRGYAGAILRRTGSASGHRS